VRKMLTSVLPVCIRVSTDNELATRCVPTSVSYVCKPEPLLGFTEADTAYETVTSHLYVYCTGKNNKTFSTWN
jgi:hypothetical protein